MMNAMPPHEYERVARLVCKYKGRDPNAIVGHWFPGGPPMRDWQATLQKIEPIIDVVIAVLHVKENP